MTSHKSRRHAKLDIRTEYGGREVDPAQAERIRLEAGFGVIAAAMLERLERDSGRPVETPDAEWLRRMLRAVEARLVEALWTLARLPQSRGPDGPKRHGVEYLPEYWDVFGNTREAGGKWESEPPRQSPPSSREIDGMDEALNWISGRHRVLDDRARCQLVWFAAATKQGDIARNVSWRRVVGVLPELTGCSVRTLQRRYEDGLRAIVAELLVRGDR